MLILARDEGPGIPDVDQALRYGCSTRKGLGVGLPGAKWLMDEFQLSSQPGCGTTVKMIKWK
jgi:serine/threonine-protein kinase RsbT